MNWTQKILSFLLFFSYSNAMYGISQNIQHIFVDINSLITTSSKEASKIVGIINSMKYTARIGHIPCKADFFKALKDIPSLSNQITYNEDLAMPTILSDWLLGLQSNHAVRKTIYNYLDKSNYSEIEKTIFKNISGMMMDPTMFIETQYIIKDITKILQQLKKNGYHVYLIGNWDKESEPYLIKLLQGNFLPDTKNFYFSNKVKYLKPHSDYFDHLIEFFQIDPKQSIVIDIEKQHASAARSSGFNSILLHNHNAYQLKSELSRLGVRI